jgi:hypothetical protein|tara:strand:+ start:316 stop:597 length:282 start_codon:yes stop_codon:yes gene_type:complete
MLKSQWAFYRGLLVGIILGAFGLAALQDVTAPPPQFIRLKEDIPSDALTLDELGICSCSVCELCKLVWIDGQWIIPTPTQRQQCGTWVQIENE